MATQFTKQREANLIESDYVATDLELTQEEITDLRTTHFVTEMRYTTETRGEPRYVIWLKPKKHTLDGDSKYIIATLTKEKSQ